MTRTPSAPVAAPALPPELAAVALVDAKTAAAVGQISKTQWYALVAAGVAPAPAFRMPRCTRWRANQIVQFWTSYRPDPAAQAQVERVVSTAAAAAKRARRARAEGGAR